GIGATINPFYYNIQPDSSRLPSQTLLGVISTHPVWLAQAADILTGPIIASMIAVTSLATYLLWEWTIQNARPGFDEEQLLAARPWPPWPPIFPTIQVQHNILALEQQQADAMGTHKAMRAMQGANGEVVGEETNRKSILFEASDDGADSSHEMRMQLSMEEEKKCEGKLIAKLRKQPHNFAQWIETAYIGASEVLLANRCKDWIAHIHTHKAKWDKSVAEEQRKKIEQRYKFGIKEEGDVNEVDGVEVDRELDSRFEGGINSARLQYACTVAISRIWATFPKL
ncbi:hypothetical protein IW261DRAFT_1665500, partial [Armillaria novae-zelandiae]